MQTTPANQVITVADISNREFLETYAQPGCVGLIGGATLIDRAIRHAERHVHPEKLGSEWSHALVFGERRPDGHLWLLESDLAMQRKHIRLGVQENRVGKYFDETAVPSLAVLDFHLDAAQVQSVLRESLELLANHTRYSLREILGTLVTLRRPEQRAAGNPLARDNSYYCSAFVRYVFHRAGIDLTPGLDPKQTSPEDLARTPLPHTTYLLLRKSAPSPIQRLRRRVKARLRVVRAKRRGAEA